MQNSRDIAFVLRGQRRGAGGDEPAPHPEPEAASREEHAVACAACLATITSTGHRIAISGSHGHRFVNPAGLLFHIACFAEAIGCTIVGPDSLEYPWFPGFAWRYAMCASCGQHLGWHFRADGKIGFFGLILDRLVQPGADA